MSCPSANLSAEASERDPTASTSASGSSSNPSTNCRAIAPVPSIPHRNPLTIGPDWSPGPFGVTQTGRRRPVSLYGALFCGRRGPFQSLPKPHQVPTGLRSTGRDATHSGAHNQTAELARALRFLLNGPRSILKEEG